MNNYNKILQYHLDHNLSRVSPKYSKALSASQKRDLVHALEINKSLKNLRSRDSLGKASLRQTLELVGSPQEVKPSMLGRLLKTHQLRVACSYLAVFVMLAAVGGVGFSMLNGTPPDTLNTSSVAANGSIENLHNLNIADAENDANPLITDEGSDKTATANIQSSSTAGEAINEDF